VEHCWRARPIRRNYDRYKEEERNQGSEVIDSLSKFIYASLSCQPEGLTMQTILDKAIEYYRRIRFWDDVNVAASHLRSDQEAWNEELGERRAWEATLADGLS
jgi:hypothetical protein